MTWVCPAGIGHCALALTALTIRRLHELPADVEIIRGLPHFERIPPAEHERDWTHQPAWDAPRAMYLLVRHRYFTRVPLGCVLEIVDLEGLLERYRALEAAEKAP